MPGVRRLRIGARRVGAPLAALLLTGALAGCGSSGSSTTDPSAASFPATDGRSLDQILGSADKANLAISPTGQIFETGKNRFGFGGFQVDNSQVADADVALYAQPL